MTRDALGRQVGGIAIAAAIVPAVLATVGLGLSLSGPSVEHLIDGHDIGDGAMAVTCGLIAWLILSRLPRQPVGVVFGVIGVFDGLCLLTSGLSDVTSRGAYTAALWATEWTWLPGLLLTLTVLPLVFPQGVDGRLGRALLRLDIGVIVALCLCQMGASRLQSGVHTTVANPVAVPGADTAELGVAALAVVCALGSIGALVHRLVRADANLRRQLLPFLAAGVVVIIVVSIAPLAGRPGVVAQDASELLIPCSALLSVLRLHLYDLEIAIRRTSVWVVLSALLLGAYVAVVQLASGWLRLSGRPSSVLATAVIAIAFGPLRALLQRVVARWLYGDRGDPYAALTHTTEVLAGSADPVGALQQATNDLALRLRSPGVRILRGDRLLAGQPGGTAGLAVALLSGSEEVGRLEILPRSVGEEFSRADERLILDLCPSLANAVAAVGLAEDLRASREMLARGREDERRRLRSELHDDIGPSLAAVAVQAQTALRRLERHDAEAAAETLRSLQTTTLRAAADLRSVIDALGPRALDEVGLPEAVRELAQALVDDRVAVEVAVADLPPLPAAVEVAVYRFIAESLTNVARHAQARRVLLRISVVGGTLEVEVSDDGIGAAALPRPGGVGLPSMRARIEEIGGDVDFSFRDHGSGATVAARIPLGVEAVVEPASVR